MNAAERPSLAKVLLLVALAAASVWVAWNACAFAWRTLTESEPWWRGGTLHAASAAEWSAATQRNKMATAADWCAKVLAVQERLRASADADSARECAVVLVNCVDARVVGADPAEHVSSAVSACHHALDWNYE